MSATVTILGFITFVKYPKKAPDLTLASLDSRGRLEFCCGFQIAAAIVGQIVVLMARRALLVDTLGRRATRRDDEMDVVQPKRPPVICRRENLDVRNSYLGLVITIYCIVLLVA